MTTIREDDWGFLDSDDQFHAPETEDPWWTETVWFSWMIPERSLLGYFYPAFRPNMGIQFGGVLVVDDTATVPWELPAFEWSWHEPLTEPPDLLDTRNLHGGMRLQCLEPGRVFRFGCENQDLSFDLTFEALCKPLLTRQVPPFDHGSHIDQPGRVAGRFELLGESFEVECIAMRDRSWGIRRPRRQPKVGYDHGTASAETGFLSISVDRKGDDRITRGYLLRDGVWSNLVDGTRSVERDQEHRPARIRIEAVDELGRELHATGRPVSRCVFNAYPHMFCWTSLTEWELDGVRCWGEDQDVWHPGKWRRFVLDERVLKDASSSARQVGLKPGTRPPARRHPRARSTGRVPLGRAGGPPPPGSRIERPGSARQRRGTAPGARSGRGHRR